MFNEGFFVFNLNLTLLIIALVFIFYLKLPFLQNKNKKIFQFFIHWFELLLLVLIPLLFYIFLTIVYTHKLQKEELTLAYTPYLGFTLSLMFIFYLELKQRLKKVNILYFFVLACIFAILTRFSFLIFPI